MRNKRRLTDGAAVFGPGLVLSRKVHEQTIVTLGGEVVIVTVLEASGGRTRLHFAAPQSVQIDRAEVADKRQREAA